ncbi:hypothetical protein BG003_003574 [Podila horticola]|nr:hypothetical protein BG003_003574 [Podila horticola]
MDASPRLHPFDQAHATSEPTSPKAPYTRKASVSFNLHNNNPLHNQASKTSESAGTVPLDGIQASLTQSVQSPVSVESSSSSGPSNSFLRNRMEGKANQIAQSSDLSSNAGTAGTDGDEQKPPMIRRNTGPGGRYIDESEHEPRWTTRVSAGLRKLYTLYSPSLTLENKGSIARDHLAVTQLFRLQQPGSSPNELIKVSNLGRPLGGSFICLGILFLWLGTSRYFHNQTVLSYGQFPASRGSVVLATVTVLSVLLACFIIVVLQGRTT